jgi:hypothetical protein
MFATLLPMSFIYMFHVSVVPCSNIHVVDWFANQQGNKRHIQEQMAATTASG